MRLRTGQVLRVMAAAAVLTGTSLMVSSCGGFFVCQGKASCPSTGTTTGTGDYAYVSNSVSGSSYVDEYTIGTGTLTAVSGSPFNLGYTPVAMKVSENDAYLYVASAPGSTNPGLYMYTISSTGALSGGTEEVSNQYIAAMEISPDGNFLYTIDTTGFYLTQYSLNTSTGAISGGTTFSAPGVSCVLQAGVTPATQACSLAVSPSENYVAVAEGATLGATSTAVFPYTTTGGITTQSYGSITTGSQTLGDYSLAFDASGYLYIARTGASSSLVPYGNLSSSSPTQETAYTGFESGATPRSVTLADSYKYLYTADEGSNYIAAFNVSAGGVSKLASVLGPNDVAALGAERSGSYLLAAGYSATNGLQLFTISSSGLTAVASQGTLATTTNPILLALTH
jgi:6-phosphogluconolactonase